MTTRGFGTAEMEALGHCIADLILAGAGSDRDAVVRTVRETAAIHVARLLCHLGGKVIQTPYGTSPPAARSEP